VRSLKIWGGEEHRQPFMGWILKIVGGERMKTMEKKVEED
jgi:hypothetical protein